MQAVKRKQGQCIFCAFQSQSGFSTSASASRRSNISEPQTFRRAQKFDEARSAQYFGQRDEIAIGRSFGNNSGARHPRYRPGRGEVFDRKDTRRDDKETREGPRGYQVFERTSDPKKLSKKLIHESTFAIQDYLRRLEKRLSEEEIFKRLNLDEKDLQTRWAMFQGKIQHQINSEGEPKPPLLQRLRLAFVERGKGGLEVEMRYSFFGAVVASRFSKTDVEDQERLANLKYPAEWFPSTRGFQREFHLHVGPTNSGKTYQALKRLEQAKTGVYAGPLRLLAHEVYMRLNARGQRCNLITGDDRRTADEGDEAPMISCTVEMVPLTATFDVAVIDEIQMIGSEDRGWAWTQAVLGVMAREVHLCGEERTIPIIKELVAACGEKLQIHRYERLSPLKMMPRSLDGRFKSLQKGDCIVCFSVATIHGLRQALEKVLKCKVAVIYGSLPPETRAAQAKLFNDPDNDYDILVASDAIGMGLNLSIKRIVFAAAHRRTGGNRLIPLSIANVKQIGGRAGRFKTAQQAVEASNVALLPTVQYSNEAPVTPVEAPKTLGWVTTLEKHDHPIITKAMESEAEPITSAGLFPPAYIVEKFARYFPPGTPFSYLLFRLHELSQTSRRFYLCDLRQQVSIADAIEPVEGLTIIDKMIFCSAPVETRKPGEPELAQSFANAVAKNTPVSILDLEDVQNLNLDLLADKYTANREYLQKLEALHKGIIIFMWLSYRYTGIFIQRELAIHTKELTEARIEEVLSQLSFDYDKMKAREQAVLNLLAKEAEKEEEDGVVEENHIPDIDPRREELMLDSLGEYGETDNTAALDNSFVEVEKLDDMDGDIEELTLQVHERQIMILSLYDEVHSSLAALRAIGKNAPLGVVQTAERIQAVEG